MKEIRDRLKCWGSVREVASGRSGDGGGANGRTDIQEMARTGRVYCSFRRVSPGRSGKVPDRWKTS